MIYERISANKYKSLALIAFFVAFVLVLGYVLGEIFWGPGFGSIALIIAAIIASIAAIYSYYYSDSAVLQISQARPLSRQEFPFLWHTMEGLAIAAGIPTPNAYVIEDTAPNAFATGRDPKHAVICVTTGLLQKLNRQELEGVIGHEMSHIKNYDTRLMAITVILVGIIALISDMILRSFLWGRRSDKRDLGRAGIIIILIGLVLAVLSPVIATIIKMAVSRKREFLADADSALLTRYPEGLASALDKISKDKEPLEAANKATAHLYIVNPLKDYANFLDSMFSTHPKIEDRVKALRGM
jgi:heat shock protein HtpX